MPNKLSACPRHWAGRSPMMRNTSLSGRDQPCRPQLSTSPWTAPECPCGNRNSRVSKENSLTARLKRERPNSAPSGAPNPVMNKAIRSVTAAPLAIPPPSNRPPIETPMKHHPHSPSGFCEKLIGGDSTAPSARSLLVMEPCGYGNLQTCTSPMPSRSLTASTLRNSSATLPKQSMTLRATSPRAGQSDVMRSWMKDGLMRYCAPCVAIASIPMRLVNASAISEPTGIGCAIPNSRRRTCALPLPLSNPAASSSSPPGSKARECTGAYPVQTLFSHFEALA